MGDIIYYNVNLIKRIILESKLEQESSQGVRYPRTRFNLYGDLRVGH